MAFELPSLGYDYAALEPYIDAQTMEIHYTKHHQAYVNNLNNAVANSEWQSKSLEELLGNVSKLPVAIRNNGGGHYNHTLFWKLLAANGGNGPSGDLLDALNKSFGSLDKFKEVIYQCGHYTLRIGLGLAGKSWEQNSGSPQHPIRITR